MLPSLNTLRSGLSLRSSGVLLSVLLLVLSLVASLCSPLIASAYNTPGDTSDDYQTVPNVFVGVGGAYGIQCEDIDITTNWSEYILDSTKWYNPNDSNYQAMKVSFENALDHGSWGVSIDSSYQGNNSGRGYVSTVKVYWREDRNQSIYHDGGNVFLVQGVNSVYLTSRYWAFGNGGCEPIAYGLDLSAAGTAMISYDRQYFPRPTSAEEAGGLVNLFANFPVTYPAGYTGSPIRDSVTTEPTPTISPELEYIVQNKKVTLKYKDNIQHQSCPVMNWTTYKQDDEETPVDQKLDQPPQNDYTFTVNEYGKYIFIADLHVPVPCAPFPDDYEVVPTLITLDVDGSSFEGNNSDLICEVRPDGYMGCVTPDATSCNLEETFIEQMSCRFNKSVSMGLINPTINAFKDVLSSFIVVSPTCQIIIQDVAILPGQSFPLSDYSGYACDSAAEFREAFPIAPILLNFFLAITQLYLVVMMINRLLNHEKNDIIEGVA